MVSDCQNYPFTNPAYDIGMVPAPMGVLNPFPVVRLLQSRLPQYVQSGKVQAGSVIRRSWMWTFGSVLFGRLKVCQIYVLFGNEMYRGLLAKGLRASWRQGSGLIELRGHLEGNNRWGFPTDTSPFQCPGPVYRQFSKLGSLSGSFS